MNSLVNVTKKVAIQRTQAPGFFRYAHGDVVVTALYDGYVSLDPMTLTGLTDEERAEDLTRQMHALNADVDSAVNAFLIHDGKQLIMVDAGSAHVAGPTMGKLLKNIAAAGYTPEDIDTIILTHMHPDHIGGITNEKGEGFFPNAIVWAHKADADFWLDTNTANGLPDGEKAFVQIAIDAAAPYIASDRFNTFAFGDEIVPGLITAVDAAGHTPGHTAFMVTSAGQNMLFWGDISHIPAIQLPHPAATIELDVFPEMAVASRKRVLADTVKGQWVVGGSHQPFPGIGRVRKEGAGYAWVAAEYGAPSSLDD